VRRVAAVLERNSSSAACCIGTELNAGYHLTESLRLLEQKRFDAALAQRQRQGDAADPAARDQDFETTMGA
jgi:hypothetical protein